MSGDTYFDFIGYPLVIRNVLIDDKGYVRVGTKSSGYPIRVRKTG
ncbi:MAG: hypothetical protein QM571_07250 [Micrococcaceae bacterium]